MRKMRTDYYVTKDFYIPLISNKNKIFIRIINKKTRKNVNNRQHLKKSIEVQENDN